MSMAKNRLITEYKKIKKEKNKSIKAYPDDKDMFLWKAIINGPKNTFYENGIFILELKFPDNYPYKPPKVKFISKMFHPNIYEDGNICLDIIKEKWNPLYEIDTLLIQIQSLLTDPNINSPANNYACNLYKEDENKYIKEVLKTVRNSWKNNS